MGNKLLNKMFDQIHVKVGVLEVVDDDSEYLHSIIIQIVIP